nr:hypothetical protein [Mycoplasmopsis bovis]
MYLHTEGRALTNCPWIVLITIGENRASFLIKIPWADSNAELCHEP